MFISEKVKEIINHFKTDPIEIWELNYSFLINKVSRTYYTKCYGLRFFKIYSSQGIVVNKKFTYIERIFLWREYRKLKKRIERRIS